MGQSHVHSLANLKAVATAVQFTPTPASPSKPKKNWDILAKEELEKEKDMMQSDDPNAGGDAAVNGLFQQIYANADDDARRAMLKSYTESGGTSLSTDWKEVSEPAFFTPKTVQWPQHAIFQVSKGKVSSLTCSTCSRDLWLRCFFSRSR